MPGLEIAFTKPEIDNLFGGWSNVLIPEAEVTLTSRIAKVYFYKTWHFTPTVNQPAKPLTLSFVDGKRAFITIHTGEGNEDRVKLALTELLLLYRKFLTSRDHTPNTEHVDVVSSAWTDAFRWPLSVETREKVKPGLVGSTTAKSNKGAATSSKLPTTLRELTLHELNLMHPAQSEDYEAVIEILISGSWVHLSEYPEEQAMLNAVLNEFFKVQKSEAKKKAEETDPATGWTKMETPEM
jgi:hypothetical protein